MRKPVLVWEENNYQHTQPLEEDRPILIGRHKECAVQLSVNTVSRRHALIHVKQGVVFLRNLSRINAIRAEDGRRVAYDETMVVDDGERFQVGPVTFQLLSLPVQVAELRIRCANCRRIVDYEPEGFCPWCGTALAAGQTVAE